MLSLTKFHEAALVSAFLLSSTLLVHAAVPACGGPPGLPIPMAANRPFTADETISDRFLVEADDSRQPVTVITRVYSIARDNDGRVAVKLTAHNPSGPTYVSVSICDPIAGTTTHFAQCSDEDGAPATSGNIPRSCQDKVAKFYPSPHRLPNAGTPFFPDPFNPLPPPILKSFVPQHGQTIDLGTQKVDGVQAHGYRNLTTGPSHIDGCKSPVKLAKEWWLSEELAIAISEVNTTQSEPVDPNPSPTTTHSACSVNGSMELSNIKRVEPAPELFKVPPDYELLSMDNPKPEKKPQQ